MHLKKSSVKQHKTYYEFPACEWCVGAGRYKRCVIRLMMAAIMWVMDDTDRMLCQTRDDANVDEHEKMRAS